MSEALATFTRRLEYSGMDRIINDADLVLVAFSGGADSSLLLYLLKEYLADKDTRVAACHLNHLIRGEEAYRDEQFAEHIAAKLGVPFYVKRVDIPALVRDGGGVEEIARRERYAFFDELAASLSSRTLIATAHNADDNLETVLFNLTRGTGISGLCGIPPVRDGKYIRPLLSYSSDEIRILADSLDIGYVVDSTNLIADYTRNKLRHLVIPHLKELNPSAERAVLRMTETLREDEAYMREAVDSFLAPFSDGGVPRESLSVLHSAVLARVLMKMFDGIAQKLHSLEKVHIIDISSHLKSGVGDFELSVPGGIVFFCKDGICCFSKKTINEPPDSTTQILELDCPMYKNGYVILITEDNISKYYPVKENIYNLSIYKAVKFDKIKGKLGVRTRRDGDTIRYGGMTRKLKKLFSEKKLPSEERERIPIICDSEGILWIPSFPARDGMSAGNDEKALHLFCFKAEQFESLGIALPDGSKN